MCVARKRASKDGGGARRWTACEPSSGGIRGGLQAAGHGLLYARGRVNVIIYGFTLHQIFQCSLGVLGL